MATAKCLNCSKEFQYDETRRKRIYCSDKCRNEVHRKKISQLLKEKLEETNPIHTEITKDKTAITMPTKVAKILEQPNKDNSARIAELEKELANPPKNLSISLNVWKAVRYSELKKLRNNNL